VTVEVQQSPSIFFAGMEGSRIPIVVAHGEGFADFSQQGDIAKARGPAFRRQPWCCDADVSAEPERFAGGHHVGYDGRWPLYCADAAPGAGVPYRDDELGAGRVEADRRWWQPVDAYVP
jgi:hypothetical protein